MIINVFNHCAAIMHYKNFFILCNDLFLSYDIYKHKLVYLNLWNILSISLTNWLNTYEVEEETNLKFTIIKFLMWLVKVYEIKDDENKVIRRI